MDRKRFDKLTISFSRRKSLQGFLAVAVGLTVDVGSAKAKHRRHPTALERMWSCFNQMSTAGDDITAIAEGLASCATVDFNLAMYFLTDVICSQTILAFCPGACLRIGQECGSVNECCPNKSGEPVEAGVKCTFNECDQVDPVNRCCLRAFRSCSDDCDCCGNLYCNGNICGLTGTDCRSVDMPAQNQSFLYTDTNYGGLCQVFFNSHPTFSGITIGNDTVSSIKVGHGVRVTVYADTNYQGRSSTFQPGQTSANLGNNVVGNDTISSIKIESVTGTTLARDRVNKTKRSRAANSRRK